MKSHKDRRKSLVEQDTTALDYDVAAESSKGGGATEGGEAFAFPFFECCLLLLLRYLYVQGASVLEEVAESSGKDVGIQGRGAKLSEQIGKGGVTGVLGAIESEFGVEWEGPKKEECMPGMRLANGQ